MKIIWVISVWVSDFTCQWSYRYVINCKNEISCGGTHRETFKYRTTMISWVEYSIHEKHKFQVRSFKGRDSIVEATIQEATITDFKCSKDGFSILNSFQRSTRKVMIMDQWQNFQLFSYIHSVSQISSPLLCVLINIRERPSWDWEIKSWFVLKFLLIMIVSVWWCALLLYFIAN